MSASLQYEYQNLHPAERKLLELIRSIGQGEIRSLKIQDGYPVLAEEIIKKHVLV